MIATHSNSNLFYYRYTKPTDVWGNLICKIQFFNSSKELVYSRNIWYHHLNALLHTSILPPIFVYWLPNADIALVYEYERPTVYDLAAIDFDAKLVYQCSLLNKENLFSNDESPKDILSYIMSNYEPVNLIVEEIDKPFFTFWEYK